MPATPNSRPGPATSSRRRIDPYSAAAATPAPAVGIPHLIRSLQEQGNQYRDLLSLLDTFNSSARIDDTHSQAVLNSIQHQLGQLQKSGDAWAELRSGISRSDTAASPELQRVLKQQEQLLKECLDRIAGLEGDFQTRKKRLQPELDDSARRRTMQSAYQRSLNTG